MDRKTSMLFIAGTIALTLLIIVTSYMSITTVNELREQVAETAKKMTLEDQIETLVFAMFIIFCWFFACPRRCTRQYSI